jgi:hypothetical protein
MISSERGLSGLILYESGFGDVHLIEDLSEYSKNSFRSWYPLPPKLSAEVGSLKPKLTITEDEFAHEFHSYDSVRGLAKWEVFGRSVNRGEYNNHPILILQPNNIIVTFENGKRNMIKSGGVWKVKGVMEGTQTSP